MLTAAFPGQDRKTARRVRRLRREDLKARFACRFREAIGCPRLHRIFEQKLGYPLDLDDPRSFNAKIQWRKLRDRNPLYPVIADKVRMRDWVSGRLGRAAGDVLVPLHHVSANPFAIPFESLPRAVAVKANHGCRWNHFADGHGPQDLPVLRRRCASWLTRSYGRELHEWAYWPIPRRILIEDLFLNSDGTMPDDLKFIMFGGRCAYVMLEHDRFGTHRQLSFDTDWRVIGFINRGERAPADWPRPPGFGRMLEIAEALSRGFDHLRVDFLFTDREFAINELTLYRGSGLNRFFPQEYDFEYGARWRLGGGTV